MNHSVFIKPLGWASSSVLTCPETSQGDRKQEEQELQNHRPRHSLLYFKPMTWFLPGGNGRVCGVAITRLSQTRECPCYQ